MRILDARGQPTDKIYKLEGQYPARFYRAISTEHVHRETIDADIKEFQKRAEKEGAVAIFISDYGQTAYVPIPQSLPQTKPMGLLEDLLTAAVDEHYGHLLYSRLADEMEKRGLHRAARQLQAMSGEEKQHEKILQEIIDELKVVAGLIG